MNNQIWFPLGLTGLISLLSTGLSRVFSNTTIWKFYDAQPFFMVQLLHLYMTNGQTIALTIWTFVGKVMPLFCSPCWAAKLNANNIPYNFLYLTVYWFSYFCFCLPLAFWFSHWFPVFPPKVWMWPRGFVLFILLIILCNIIVAVIVVSLSKLATFYCLFCG